MASAGLLSVLNKMKKVEDFLHFLSEIFGYIEKKSYLCMLFQRMPSPRTHVYNVYSKITRLQSVHTGSGYA